MGGQSVSLFQPIKLCALVNLFLEVEHGMFCITAFKNRVFSW